MFFISNTLNKRPIILILALWTIFWPLPSNSSDSFLMPADERNFWWESIVKNNNFISFSPFYPLSAHISENSGDAIVKSRGFYKSAGGRYELITRSTLGEISKKFDKNVINTRTGYPAFPRGCLEDKTANFETIINTPYMTEYICDVEEPNKLAAIINVLQAENGSFYYQLEYPESKNGSQAFPYPEETVSPLYLSRPITFSTEGYQQIPEENLSDHHEIFFENNVVRPINSRDGENIEYHMYVPKEFYKTRKPMPVIFVVYGGGTLSDFQKETALNFERMMAHFGCIVVVIEDEERPEIEPAGDPIARINYKTYPQTLFEDIEDVYEVLSKTQEEGGLYEIPYIRKGETKVLLQGGSFGGGLVLKVATDPKYNILFDAYITHVGEFDIANLEGRLSYKKFARELADYDWERTTEQKADQKDYYYEKNYLTNEEYNKKISPIYHLDNLERPVLAVQGIKDVQVSPYQSIDLLDKAREANKEQFIKVHFITDAGHSDPKNFDDFKERYELEIDFIQNVVNGMVEFPPEDIEKQQEIRRLAKKQIKSMHPILQTRKGMWFALLREACFNNNGGEKHETLRELLLEEGLSDSLCK